MSALLADKHAVVGASSGKVLKQQLRNDIGKDYDQ